MTRPVFVGLVLATAAALHEPLRRCVAATGESAPAGAPVQAPRFEVDPFWPKPLPNHWVMGSTIGLSVDAQDHVWVIHRPQTVEDNFKAADLKPKVGACCSVAPPVLEFDPGRQLSSVTGAGPARATNGRRATTASPSITTATSGSGETATATRRS